MIIREARVTDFDAVVKLENACFLQPYNIEQMRYEFNGNPLNKILVACIEDQIVGFVDYMITFNSATITQIAVDQTFRKQGIATKLLIEMENTFPTDIEEVVENTTLEVRESNLAAINLYKKSGYEVVTIKKHYYEDGENAIYMVKRLLLCR